MLLQRSLHLTHFLRPADFFKMAVPKHRTITDTKSLQKYMQHLKFLLFLLEKDVDILTVEFRAVLMQSKFCIHFCVWMDFEVLNRLSFDFPVTCSKSGKVSSIHVSVGKRN